MRKNIRRFSAFLIDALVILLIFMLLYFFLPTNDSINISDNITKLTEKVLNSEMGRINYFEEFSRNMYLLDHSRVVFNGINAMIIMLYFILVPIMTKGYTLGLYITGLKLKGDLSVKNLFLRNLIATGLLYLILSIILVYATKDTLYFVLLSILGIIQFLLVIISTFMIIYRKDKKGLQDIISSIEVK